MSPKEELEKQVLEAARDNGISAVLFRNAIGRKLGLNTTESECLSLLAIYGVATPTEIAIHIGLTTGATTSLLDRLEKAGYIKREPNPSDRRGVLIKASEQWFTTAGPLVAGVQVAHRQLINSYSAQELQVITSFLTRFTANVREQTARIDRNNNK